MIKIGIEIQDDGAYYGGGENNRELIMDLFHRLKGLTETWGADFLGVADLKNAYNEILAQGGPNIAHYPRAVAVGIALAPSIVDSLPHRSHRAVAVNYRHHGYDVINQRLDLLVSHLNSLLQRAGYQAMPIPASKRIDSERICGAFSHKLAAHLAGLGWIGKSCLLVTPEAGPRVRWATVLTDAPLPMTGQPMKEQCGSCNLCVEACPVHAFTGKSFCESDPREKRYDAGKCDQYFAMMKKTDPEMAVCGMCLYVCPYGQKSSL